MTQSLAWYVAYGSNLSAERFHLYVAGCRDTTPPRRWAPVELPHRLLFARRSHTWGGGGVAFVDPAAAPGVRTLGRAWLLTLDQFADVVAQECGVPTGSLELPDLTGASVVVHPGHWYGCVVPIGVREGWPLVTFTDEDAAGLEPRSPAPSYRSVVAAGLAEAHGLSAAEAHAYVDRHSRAVDAPGLGRET